jgi:hypothetical protein
MNLLNKKKDCRATGRTNGTNGGTSRASQLHISTTTEAAGPWCYGIGHMVPGSLGMSNPKNGNDDDEEGLKLDI